MAEMQKRTRSIFPASASIIESREVLLLTWSVLTLYAQSLRSLEKCAEPLSYA